MKPIQLYLFPIPIHEDYITFADDEYKSTLEGVDVIVAERIRTARRWIAKLKLGKAIDDYTWIEIPKKNIKAILPEVKQHWKEKKVVGIMSESGTPCIADPGNAIVSAAQERNIRVKPLVGPNSIMLALMASGLNGQNFTFKGYLPIKVPELQQELKKVEQVILKQGQTQIYIETPYRNERLMTHLLGQLSPNIQLCIASNLTAQDEQIQTKPIKAWKQQRPELGKKYCIFLLGR